MKLTSEAGRVLFLFSFLLLGPVPGASWPGLVPRAEVPLVCAQEAGKHEGQVLGREEIVRLLEARLEESMPGKKIRIHDLQVSERVPLPSGPLSLEVRLPERLRGESLLAALIMKAAGREVKRVPLPARISISGKVVLTRRYLKRHHEIAARDLFVAEKNLLPLPADVVTDPAEAVGKRTTLTLNGEEILRSSMLETPPLVKKGDRVNLIIEREGFKITAGGEALEEGRRGERVKLINLASKKEISGRILDARNVRVDF